MNTPAPTALLDEALRLTHAVGALLDRDDLEPDALFGKLTELLDRRETLLRAIGALQLDTVQSESDVHECLDRLRAADAELLERLAAEKSRVAGLLTNARQNLRSQAARGGPNSSKFDGRA